jgi:AraC-like DNA-binding protein
MEIYDMIEILVYVFVLSNALMLGLLFFTTKSDNKKANILLGIFLLINAFQFFKDILNEIGYAGLTIEPFLLSLPLLFFYLLITINKKIENWHFLLFIPGIIHNILLHYNGSFFKENAVTKYEAIIYLLEIALMVYAFKILQNHKEKLTDFYSNLDNKSLTWLKSIFGLNILIHLLSISTFIYDLSHLEIVESSIDTAALGLTAFMIFWIAHKGFSQPEIFRKRLFLAADDEKLNLEEGQGDILLDEDDKLVEVKEQGCAEESIKTEQDIRKFTQIKEKIRERELFINPKLNLRSLAKDLDVKEKELSRLINACGNINFYQLINEFRIEKFKQLLESPKASQFTLLGLAIKSGFSSKSTFYTAFKKLEGMSPKQYEKSIKKS